MPAGGSERHKVLAECATMLLHAENREGILEVALNAVQTLAAAASGDDPVVARFVPAEASSPFTASFLEALERGMDHAVPFSRGDGEEGTGFVAQVRDPSGSRVGFLVVEGPIVDGSGFVGDLRNLCIQVEMALHAAEVADAKIRERSEKVFRSLVKNSSDQYTLISRDLAIRSLSPAVEKMVENRHEQVVGKTILDFVHPDDVADLNAAVDEIVEGGKGSTVKLEYRVRYDDGTWRFIESVFTNHLDEPHIESIVVNSRDNSMRRNLEKELVRREMFDHLTGLPNRSLFLEKAALALTRVSHRRGQVAVVLLDFDDFQLVNDSFGHAAGDELLKAAAAKLETIVRSDDIIAHIGGDEFAILVSGGEMPRGAELVAKRAFDVLEDPIVVDTTQYNVRVSMGIAFGGSGMTAEDLLRNADLATATAKKNGKGRIEVFRDEMHEEVVRKLHTATDLRRAIGDGEIEPFFQPIVNVGTGEIIGCEALARWRHPERGLVQPFEFIPLAEATGLIVPMGVEILRKSCTQCADWRKQGLVGSPFYVSVNVSPIQLQRDDMVEVVSTVIRESGVDPKSVVLEVTESCAMQHIEEAMERLDQLKRIGIRIALDDFGTGYSSLSYLSRLPMDIMKIDKSFVDRMTGGNEELKIVKTMIDLGASLDLTTLAEGVEEEGQPAVLNRLGCRSYQGYYFAKPMPVADFVEVLAAQKKGAASALAATSN